MKRKFKEGDEIAIGEYTLRITRAGEHDAFGSTAHYGFLWQDNGKYDSGWMPIEIMEAIGRKVE